MNKNAALLGLGVVTTCTLALWLLGQLDPDFDYLQDFVSKLDAPGRP